MSEESQGLNPAESESGVPPQVEPDTTEADEQEARGEDQEQSDEQPEEKPKGGFQRRIAELTRNWRETERRLSESDRRNDELVRYITGLQNQQPQQEEQSGPPTLEQYGYDEEKYQAAVADYFGGVAKKAARSEFETLQKQRESETRVQSFRDREQQFAAEHPEYVDKVYNSGLMVSETMAGLIAESDLGPQVALHLADNRDKAARLYNLPDVQVAREIGKIEAALSAPAPKDPPNTPPPPPKLPKGGDQGDVSVRPNDPDSDRLSTEEWLKRRQKQLSKR